MAAMVERKCRCGVTFQAREADVKRGWGKSCSKSCAAIKREKRTGAYSRYLAGGGYSGETASERRRRRDHTAGMDAMDWGWDGHKNVF